MIKIFFIIVIVFILLSFTSLPVISLELTYSRVSDTEPWTPYIKELITEALNAYNPSDVLNLKPSKVNMAQLRALRSLRNDHVLDVFWTMTSENREQDLFVLRIPLLKGLLGNRLLVIRKSDTKKFRSIKFLEHAKRFTYGQGHDWPDADVLENAGLMVLRTSSYKSLMKMLDRGRFDAYPLGMNEIWAEVEKRPHLKVMVDTNIVFSYNAPVFIFLNPSNTKLRIKLEKGFKKIIENGTFEKKFNSYYKDIITQANLNKRTIFKLKNPGMSKETREAMKRFPSIFHEEKAGQ